MIQSIKYGDYLKTYKNNKKANSAFFEGEILQEIKKKYFVHPCPHHWKIITNETVYNYYPKGQMINIQTDSFFQWYPCNFDGIYKMFCEDDFVPTIRDYIFRFGKFSGKSIYKIENKQYLEFLLQQDWLREDARYAIATHLKYGVII